MSTPNTNRSSRFRRLTSAMALFAALAGCATLSETECRTGDWGQIGYNDGSVGNKRDIIGEHDKACARGVGSRFKPGACMPWSGATSVPPC